MIEKTFCDILWVEDEQQEVEKYFSQKHYFRVDLQKYMLKLLEDLEREEIFSRYSCAILDINLNSGFGYYDTIEGEEEKSETDELNEIKKILERNRIHIRSQHDLEENTNDFKKNAGYYVYLYLVNRGMPPSRICMLTANTVAKDDNQNKDDNPANTVAKDDNQNKDKNENITGAWKPLFEDAGLKPPEDFDRSLVKTIPTFESWLNETLTPAARLRSCIIGMSFYAEKLLENETLKIHLQNLYRIPLRLSEDTKIASPEFVSALWQIVQPWESHEDLTRAYQMTLKTTRNWLAHRCLKGISLMTAAFLFGIGLRGLLGKNIRRKIDTTSDDENIKGYQRWEKELLLIIKELDNQKTSTNKEFGQIVMESCKEFFTRVKNSPENFKIELTTDVCTLIAQTIGQKKNNIDIYEEDLLRCFLHGVYTIKWRGNGRIYDTPNHALGIVFDFDNEEFNRQKDSKETKYLNAVKNTLILAINQK